MRFNPAEPRVFISEIAERHDEQPLQRSLTLIDDPPHGGIRGGLELLLVLRPLGQKGRERPGNQALRLPAGMVINLRHLRSGILLAAGAVHRFRRHVESRHDRGIHRDKVEFAHLLVIAGNRRIGQSALIRFQQFKGGLERLRLLFAVGDQNAGLMRLFQLHRGDAGAGRGSRHLLNRHLRHPRLLEESGQSGLCQREGIMAIEMEPSVECAGAGLCEHTAIGEIGPG